MPALSLFCRVCDGLCLFCLKRNLVDDWAMIETSQPEIPRTEPKNTLYRQIEDKILLRVVLPLKRSGLSPEKIASELQVSFRRIQCLIEQAEIQEACYPRNKAMSVRDRIQQAVADLLARGPLPSDISALRLAMSAYRISDLSLKRHQDLWHPGYCPHIASAMVPRVEKPSIDPRKAWNQRQSQAARDRIQQAVADLRERGDFPDKATARFNQLVKYRISGTTLYKHRDLWDPECVQDSTGLQVAQ
jgi:hypothetical protein